METSNYSYCILTREEGVHVLTQSQEGDKRASQRAQRLWPLGLSHSDGLEGCVFGDLGFCSPFLSRASKSRRRREVNIYINFSFSYVLTNSNDIARAILVGSCNRRPAGARRDWARRARVPGDSRWPLRPALSSPDSQVGQPWPGPRCRPLLTDLAPAPRLAEASQCVL